MEMDLRNHLFNKLLELSPGYYDNKEIPEIQDEDPIKIDSLEGHITKKKSHF